MRKIICENHGIVKQWGSEEIVFGLPIYCPRCGLETSEEED
jgi:hypothetical protein